MEYVYHTYAWSCIQYIGIFSVINTMYTQNTISCCNCTIRWSTTQVSGSLIKKKKTCVQTILASYQLWVDCMLCFSVSFIFKGKHRFFLLRRKSDSDCNSLNLLSFWLLLVVFNSWYYEDLNMYALNPRNHINSKKNPQLSILSYYIALKLYDLGFFFNCKNNNHSKKKKRFSV